MTKMRWYFFLHPKRIKSVTINQNDSKKLIPLWLLIISNRYRVFQSG